jgi:hypothetical protein
MATRVYKVGFAITDTAGDLLCLSAATSADAKYDCFENADTNYAPSGKACYIGHLDLSGGAGAASIAKIYYGDDAKDDSTAPTGAKQVTGSFYLLLQNTTYSYDVLVPIPDTKYPHLNSGGGAQTATAYAIQV